MRRFLTPPLALLAGLALFLSGCSGESPTSPTGGTGGSGGGTCKVSISLAATSVTPLAGTAVIVRATVTKNGAPVPDGTSVYFSTDYGYFLESGLPTVSKVSVGGFADVTLASGGSGQSRLKATFECGVGTLTVEFKAVPVDGPFVSSIVPNQGSCAGGDAVVINGGRFGASATATNTRVTFGGASATITSISDTRIAVLTPTRTLANPQVPETVDVVVTLNTGSAGARAVTFAKGFTYSCVDPNKRIFVASVVPNSGSPQGGDIVVVNGQNFGTNTATTRLTFGGVPASIIGQTDSAISATTPRHLLANPSVPETVDVGVSIDLGLVSQQSAVLPQGFTYRSTGPGPGDCNKNPGLYVSSLSPNTGNPAGGDLIVINGGGFGSVLSRVRVEFGGKPGQVTNVGDNQITVSTPQRTLANPDVPETVDLVVTADVGGPNQACAKLSNAFTYTRVALEPVIYSSSPRSGPNDASTRVSLFGTGFQFPTQVFLTGGACGAARIEAVVVSIKSDMIVFLTPIAQSGNVCLANQLVDIEIVNPTTGKKASCRECFRYYDCPTITAIEPGLGPYTGGTRVTISGHNFEEPVVVTGGTSPWQVVSVSSSSIVAITTPPVLTGCSDVSGAVNVVSTGLSCPIAVGPIFTFQVATSAPVITGVFPGTSTVPLVQAGGGVTVTGANFIGNLRVIVHLPSGDVSIVPTVNSTTSLSFTAPAFTGAFKTQDCLIGSQKGTQNIDTAVAFDIVNLTTTCKASDFIVYRPTDTTCRLTAAFALVASGTTAATLCSAYSGGTFTASGGTPPYVVTVSGATLPPGVAASGTTSPVMLSGIPRLAAPGAGLASTAYAVTATATDAAAGTASATLTITVADPGAPFAISGSAAQTIANGFTGTALTAAPTAFTPITWTTGVISPSPAPGFITVSSPGSSTTIGVSGGVPANTYTVPVIATDSACTNPHRVTFNVTVTVP